MSMPEPSPVDLLSDSNNYTTKDFFQLQLVPDPGVHVSEGLGAEVANLTPTVVCTKYEVVEVQQPVGPSTSYFITPYTVKRAPFGFLESDDLDMTNDPAFNEFWACGVDSKFLINLSDYYGALPKVKKTKGGSSSVGIGATDGGNGASTSSSSSLTTTTEIKVEPATEIKQVPAPRRFILKEKVGQIQSLSHLTLAEIQTKLQLLPRNTTRKVWVVCRNVVLTCHDLTNFFNMPEIAGSITHLTYGWSQAFNDAHTKIYPDFFAALVSRLPNLEYLSFNFNFNMDINDTGMDGNLTTTVTTIMNRPTTPFKQMLYHLKTLRFNEPYLIIWSLIREIIRAAPNLQSIYGFPWAQINTLRSIEIKKMVGRTMKSFVTAMPCFPLRSNQDNVGVIQTVSGLPQLQLEELYIYFHFMPNQFQHSHTHSALKNNFSRLLKLSATSLKMLEFQPMEFVGFLDFAPCMEALTTLKFIEESPAPEIKVNKKGQRPNRSKKRKSLFGVNFTGPLRNVDPEPPKQVQTTFNKYFPKGFDLISVFPKLLNICIRMRIDDVLPPPPSAKNLQAPSGSGDQGAGPSRKRKSSKDKTPEVKQPLEIFEDFFPPETFNPDRPLTSVRHLRLEESMPTVCLQRLAQLFPNLTTFTFQTDSGLDLLTMLPKVFSLWPNLESLCLKMDTVRGAIMQNGLDSVLTGIPEERCETIRASAKSGGLAGLTGENNNLIVSKGMVEQYRTQPAITNMRSLRLLKMEVKSVFVKNTEKDPSLFSCVSAIYAFGLLPTLEFHLKFRPECSLADKNEMLYLLRHVRSFITVDG